MKLKCLLLWLATIIITHPIVSKPQIEQNVPSPKQRPVILLSNIENPKPIDVILYSGYFIDQTKKLRVEEINQMASKGGFIKPHGSPMQLGYTSNPIWFRFQIQNQAEKDVQRQWFLEFLNPVISFIDVFYADNQNRIIHIYSGGAKRVSAENLYHVNSFTDITDHVSSNGFFYVKMESIFSLVIGMRIITANEYYIQDSKNRILPNIVVGILFVLFLFNFFLYITLLDKTYLLYSLEVLFSLPQLMSNFGLLRIIFTEHTELETYFLNISLSIWVVFALLFMKKFLNFETLQPFLNKLIAVVSAFWILFGLFNYWVPPTIYYNTLEILGFTGLGIGIYGSIRALVSGYKPAIFFLGGYVIFTALYGIYLSMMVQVIPVTNFAFFLVIPGLAIAGEGIMFSFALANRYRRIEEENKAYIEIKKDMLFAVETQKRLFPAKISNHANYHIVGSYFPSSQMSGDFYDIIESHDKKTISILIADVAGHGYSAAIISAMVKVAFHESNKISTSLSQQLVKMNRILCTMVTDTFITAGIIQINYEKATATYAQAGHMPLLICKKKNASIQFFKPAGLPLGILPEVSYWQEDAIALDKGDRIFMHTDGLTELVNTSNIMFGEEKLLEFIRSNQASSGDTFSKHLTMELKQWDKTHLTSHEDDITFVVYDVL